MVKKIQEGHVELLFIPDEAWGGPSFPPDPGCSNSDYLEGTAPPRKGVEAVKNRVTMQDVVSGGRKKSVRHLTIPELQKAAYDHSCEAGFRDDTAEMGTQIALMHSELSEALEALRTPGVPDKHLPEHNPVVVEFADVVIRILDTCEAMGEDLETILLAKMAFNKTRGHKHGGKEF